ncbi:MAG: class I SAM-dependent methyltransferase [Bacteroidota bacterium]|nr:class I SAM-dependent methyltransferase [Bacteroidota bacterium]
MKTIGDTLEEQTLSCPACGSKEWIARGQAKDFSVSGEWFEIRECPNCHLKATFPQPSFNDIGRYYASQDYISHSDTRTGLINRLYHTARDYMMRKKYNWVRLASGLTSGRLLDVGAGTGHFAKYMKDHGWDVLALEPDNKARKVASEKLGLDILPLESLADQQKDSYDVITLWHVLEHVHNVEGYIDQFHAILKTAGTLIIAVPNHTSTDAKKYGEKWAAYDVPRHLWHFSPASMKILLERHGFNLHQKINMPLDGFYVSMLSEKYKGNGLFGNVPAFFSGLQSFLAGRKNVDMGSSIIYVSKKKYEST